MHLKDLAMRESFIADLDRRIALVERNPMSVACLLIHNTFGEGNEIGMHYGAREAAQRLSALTHSLRAALPPSDKVCRTGQEFWILSPLETSSDRVCDKTRGIFDAIEHSGLHLRERKTAVFNLAHVHQYGHRGDSRTAEHLLGYLSREREFMATCQCTSEAPCAQDFRQLINTAVLIKPALAKWANLR